MTAMRTNGRPLGALIMASVALLCISVDDARGEPTINWPTEIATSSSGWA
jgi:hypothetical protein